MKFGADERKSMHIEGSNLNCAEALLCYELILQI